MSEPKWGRVWMEHNSRWMFQVIHHILVLARHLIVAYRQDLLHIHRHCRNHPGSGPKERHWQESRCFPCSTTILQELGSSSPCRKILHRRIQKQPLCHLVRSIASVLDNPSLGRSHLHIAQGGRLLLENRYPL